MISTKENITIRTIHVGESRLRQYYLINQCVYVVTGEPVWNRPERVCQKGGEREGGIGRGRGRTKGRYAKLE